MIVEFPAKVDDKVKETVIVVLELVQVTPDEMFAPPLKLRLQLIPDDP